MISIIDQEWQLQLAIKREREETVRITQYLLKHHRYDDLERTTTDENFRQQILDEIDNQ